MARTSFTSSYNNDHRANVAADPGYPVCIDWLDGASRTNPNRVGHAYTPADARALAATLLEAADIADGNVDATGYPAPRTASDIGRSLDANRHRTTNPTRDDPYPFGFSNYGGSR